MIDSRQEMIGATSMRVGGSTERAALPFCAGLILILAAMLAAACGKLDPETSFARAQSSFSENDYSEASIHARNTLQAQEDHVEARVLIGRVALALGDLQDAEFHLRRAVAYGAPPQQYAVPLAETLARLGNVAAGIELLDTVPVLKRSAEYWIVRGDLLTVLGELDAAKNALDQADVGNTADSVALLTARARLALAHNDVFAAQTLLRRAVDVDESDPTAYALFARVAMTIGALSEAVYALDRAVDGFRQRGQHNQAAPALLQLVQLQVLEGAIEAADASAERLTSWYPNSLLAHHAKGLVALRQGSTAVAIEELRQAVAMAQGQPELDALLGAAYLAAGNLGQAEQQLLAALGPSRPAPAVVRLLAETRLRQGRPGPALDALARLDGDLIQRDPSLALLQGTAHLEAGDPATAVRFLELAVIGAPANTTASLQLARAYNVTGRNEDAARLMRTSPAFTGDQSYASNVALVIQALEMQGGDAARALVSEILDEDPQSPAGLLVAATLEYLTNDRLASRRHVEQVLDVDNTFVPALFMMAALEAEEGRTAEAETRLRRVLEIEPGHSAAALAVARLRMASRDAVGAREVLRGAASRQDAPPAGLLVAMGDLERQLGNLDEARRISSELQQRFPERTEGFLLQGRLDQSTGAHLEAARAYRAAYDLEQSLEALQGAVSSMRAAGDPGWEALLKERISSESDDVPSRLMLADALQASERNAEALSHYQEILARDENNLIALNNAAWLLHETDAAKALEYAERAVALAPANGAVLDTLGWVLVTIGRAGEALAHLETATRLSPGQAEIRYHLAVAQARAGENEAARQTLQRLLAEESSFPSRDEARALLGTL